MLDGQGLGLEAHGQPREVVHVDHLVRAQVQRLVAVGEHDADGALHAVVDEHEGARLQPVAPQLELARGHHGLAAEGGRNLLAAALPRACGAVQATATHTHQYINTYTEQTERQLAHPVTSGPVHVVVSGDAGLHGEVLGVRDGHLLRIQLLQTVGVLGTSGPSLIKDTTQTIHTLRHTIEQTSSSPGPYHVLREPHVFRIHLESFVVHTRG